MIIITENKQEETELPQLMIGLCYSIILATKIENGIITGVCLKSRTKGDIGKEFSDWAESKFLPYKGSITLKNK